MKKQEERITPEVAREYLKANTDNRRFRQAYADQLTRAMGKGDYVDAVGSRIIFDVNGVLRNGQHTLSAIVASGKPQTLDVIRDAPEDIYGAIDKGLSRSFSDGVGLHMKNAGYYAAVARMLLKTENGEATPFSSSKNSNKGNVRYSDIEVMDYLQNHPEIDGTYARSRRIANTLGVPTATLGYCQVLFSRYDNVYSELFFDALETGADLSTGDPILTLRDKLLRIKGSKNVKVEKTTKLVYIIKAFNYYVHGRKLFKISYDKDRERNRIPAIGEMPK